MQQKKPASPAATSPREVPVPAAAERGNAAQQPGESYGRVIIYIEITERGRIVRRVAAKSASNFNEALSSASDSAQAAAQEYPITFMGVPLIIPANLPSHVSTKHPSFAHGLHWDQRLVLFHADIAIPQSGVR